MRYGLLINKNNYFMLKISHTRKAFAQSFQCLLIEWNYDPLNFCSTIFDY